MLYVIILILKIFLFLSQMFFFFFLSSNIFACEEKPACDKSFPEISSYMERNYILLNKISRDHNLFSSSSFKEELSYKLVNLAREYDKIEDKYEGMSYRGLRLTSIQKKNILENYKKNDIISFPSFTSSSQYKHIAMKFAKAMPGIYSHEYIIEIKGSSGKDISKLARKGNNQENEILFHPNSLFKIIDINEKYLLIEEVASSNETKMKKFLLKNHATGILKSGVLNIQFRYMSIIPREDAMYAIYEESINYKEKIITTKYMIPICNIETDSPHLINHNDLEKMKNKYFIEIIEQEEIVKTDQQNAQENQRKMLNQLQIMEEKGLDYSDLLRREEENTEVSKTKKRWKNLFKKNTPTNK